MIVIHPKTKYNSSCYALNPERISLLQLDINSAIFRKGKPSDLAAAVADGVFEYIVYVNLSIYIQDCKKSISFDWEVKVLDLDYNIPGDAVKKFIRDKIITLIYAQNDSESKFAEINLFTPDEHNSLAINIFKRIYKACFEAKDGAEILLADIIENEFKTFIINLVYNQKPEIKEE